MCRYGAAPYTCSMTTSPHIRALSQETAESFVAALSRRDFAGLAALTSPTAPIRALTPSGLTSGTGPAFMEERFDTWFGGDDRFTVEETTVASAGEKLHLCWRIARTGSDGSVRKAEQRAFARVSDRIDSLDLVCTGYWEVAS